MAASNVRDIRLDGRVAIVTGAGSGLGRAMSRALCAAGAKVAFLDVAAASAKTVADAAEANGGAALAVQCDITREADCARAVAETVAAFGALHILVNCAARGNIHVQASPKTKSLKFWEADAAIWQQVITTNVNGSFLMSHAAAPHLIAAGWGRIVNITTSLATMQRRENSPYAISKVAMEGATLVWAKDLTGTGVTCNSLIPGGAVDTPFLQHDSRAEIGDRVLQPEVVVAPMLWLASDLSDGVTGARFVGKHWDGSLPPNEAAAKAREAPVIVQPPAGTR